MITLLQQIPTVYTSLLTDWLIASLKREQRLQKLLPSWTKLQKISWNLIYLKSYQELAKVTNAYEQKMDMAREVIADKGIWTAKKRYILNVYDMKVCGIKEPHLKIMGIEAVKSSYPCTMSRED